MSLQKNRQGHYAYKEFFPTDKKTARTINDCTGSFFVCS